MKHLYWLAKKINSNRAAATAMAVFCLIAAVFLTASLNRAKASDSLQTELQEENSNAENIISDETEKDTKNSVAESAELLTEEHKVQLRGSTSGGHGKDVFLVEPSDAQFYEGGYAYDITVDPIEVEISYSKPADVKTTQETEPEIATPAENAISYETSADKVFTEDIADQEKPTKTSTPGEEGTIGSDTATLAYQDDFIELEIIELPEETEDISLSELDEKELAERQKDLEIIQKSMGDEESQSEALKQAKLFWGETEKPKKKGYNLNISGTKTFDLKRSDISGDMGHFISKYPDAHPGSKIDQSLHLEINGNITENATVHAVLDDTETEDRRFTVDINTPKWHLVLGDFQFKIDNAELSVFPKETRGILAHGRFTKNYEAMYLFAQSKGVSRREQFRGAGQQQEYRLQGSPVLQNSEKITIDGRPITRGIDYLIDYDDGLIKFLPKVLPIEIISWIVVEYELTKDAMPFKRNMYGTRQIYKKDEDRKLALTWLKEVDDTSGKNKTDSDTASSTSQITPMSHDLLFGDFHWKLSEQFSLEGEIAKSKFEANKKNLPGAPETKKAYAGRIELTGESSRMKADLSHKRSEAGFKAIGREKGIIEVGERGPMDDVRLTNMRLTFKLSNFWSIFAEGEKTETNLDENPAESSVDLELRNAGIIFEREKHKERFEIRKGKQIDRELSATKQGDLTKNTAAAVYDRTFGAVKTQAKYDLVEYVDAVNIASGSKVIQTFANASSRKAGNFSWTASVSEIRVDDGFVSEGPRSETNNWTLDVSYDPSRKFSARGEFQFRREDDFYNNSRNDSAIIDSNIKYEPTQDIKTQLKYKIENTSKITRDPSLDPVDYIVPDSLPTSEKEKTEIINRFENPVEKITASFMTDYRITDRISAYADLRRREINDKHTKLNISEIDRQTYELKFTPLKNIMVIAEYDKGYSINNDSKSRLDDTGKLLQINSELKNGYKLELSYEIYEEDDIYASQNDKTVKSKILDLQRALSPKLTVGMALQHDNISSATPSKEFEKRVFATYTPANFNKRYKLFANHTDIENVQKKEDGSRYEYGLSFSQFIGADTMLDGEIKRVHSDKTALGDAYSATVINAKMVITF